VGKQAWLRRWVGRWVGSLAAERLPLACYDVGLLLPAATYHVPAKLLITITSSCYRLRAYHVPILSYFLLPAAR
jgi:hypothetical protein